MLQVVWFKRDLRVEDHAALAGAARQGPVLALYVAEPELWQQPDASGRQWEFARECLAELRDDLERLGLGLVVRTGDVVEVFEAIRATHGIAALWSHQETGNAWTFARDRRVAAWARSHGISWHEPRHNGVIRRLTDRNGWAKAWDRQMAEPSVTVPRRIDGATGIASDPLPEDGALGLAPDHCPGRQIGGRRAALELLDSFLAGRGRNYRREMSSPLTAETSCSRLSPHLAWGTLSMREVAQATWRRLGELKGDPRPEARALRASLVSFSGRLHWHCHFMQKLESQPDIEFRNLHRACDGLRPDTADPARLAAWAEGRTGLPFVDACMRSLATTGWLNFRMRAMVMAVASYHLWLPWRDTGLVLARLFTDYEAGIHWPQAQMQSGTTGINLPRIYNPIKQSRDQDPDGRFIRRWQPELAPVPDAFIHEPWTWEGFDAEVAGRYPRPIVDHVAAAREARERIWSARAGRAAREGADAIQERHGSRKSGLPMTGRGKRPKAQLSFDL